MLAIMPPPISRRAVLVPALCRPLAGLVVGLLLSAVAAAPLSAMDMHNGIVAMPIGDDELESCGGSAVVITADGTAVTLSEALPAAYKDPADTAPLLVTLPGGARRWAHIVKRGTTTTAIELHIDHYPASAGMVAVADATVPVIGCEVWTVGNTTGAIADDGQPALSRGTISGVYDLPVDAPVVRGRMGRILSDYRGPVYETDAGINDGNQGGALLDARGHLLALVSLGQARERRLGTAVPINLVLDDLGLKSTRVPGAAAMVDTLATVALKAAGCLALIRFERVSGLGNPQGVPRPPRTVAETPSYDRDQVTAWWDMYYAQSQVFYTDQPAPAIVIDAKAGLLITAAGNLHGGVKHGLIIGNGPAVPCEVVAVNEPLDLALLRTQGALPQTSAVFSTQPVHTGQAIELVTPLRIDDAVQVAMTRGVISAVGRRLKQTAHAWLQISARANYSSLGSAVVDDSGRIVGMSALLSPEGEWLINSGVSMALDGSEIAHALDKLKAGVNTERLPVLGMGVTLNEELSGGRLMITGVIPGTGAAVAGLRAKDVLQKVDGVPATSQAAIARALLKHQAGDKVPVEFLRKDVVLGDKTATCQVELTEFEPQQ